MIARNRASNRELKVKSSVRSRCAEGSNRFRQGLVLTIDHICRIDRDRTCGWCLGFKAGDKHGKGRQDVRSVGSMGSVRETCSDDWA